MLYHNKETGVMMTKEDFKQGLKERGEMLLACGALVLAGIALIVITLSALVIGMVVPAKGARFLDRTVLGFSF